VQSNLQIKLNDFFELIKKLAIIMAIIISAIRTLRKIAEIFLIGESVTIFNEEWKSKMRVV